MELEELEKGCKVVHVTHGVGTICGVEEKNYGAGPQEYYLLKIEATGLIVRFPKTGSSTSVVRRLIDASEVDKVYTILKSPGQKYSMVWNRRKKELSEKIKSGSVYEIAEVLRDLNQLRFGKDLSFGEKEMMEKAKARIVTEVSAAKKVTESAVDEELERILVHQ